jgi:hypothetical protein
MGVCAEHQHARQHMALFDHELMRDPLPHVIQAGPVPAREVDYALMDERYLLVRARGVVIERENDALGRMQLGAAHLVEALDRQRRRAVRSHATVDGRHDDLIRRYVPAAMRAEDLLGNCFSHARPWV